MLSKPQNCYGAVPLLYFDVLVRSALACNRLAVVHDLLTDPDYIAQAFLLGFGDRLQRNYREILDPVVGVKSAEVLRLQRWAQLVIRNRPALDQFAGLSGFCCQQAINAQLRRITGKKNRERADSPMIVQQGGVRGALTEEGLRDILQHHGHGIRNVAMSGDARWGLCSSDKIVYFWDLQLSQMKATMTSPAVIRALTMSANGARAAAVGTDGVIRIWDLQRGCRVRILRRGRRDLRCVELSDDGKRLVSACTEGYIQFWNLDSFRCDEEIAIGGTGLRSIALSRDDGRVVAGFLGGSIRHVDTSSGRVMGPIRLPLFAVQHIALSRNGEFSVCAGPGSSLVVCAMPTGQVTLLPLHCHTTLGETINGVTLVDEDRTAVAATGRAIISFDVAKKERIGELVSPNDVSSLCISRDGRIALTGCEGVRGLALTWELSHGDRTASNSARVSPIEHARLVPSGNGVVAWSSSGCALVVKLNSRHSRHWRTAGEPGSGSKITINSDGGRAALSSPTAGISLLQLRGPRKLIHLGAEREWINDCCFSPDGKLLFAAKVDGSTAVWLVGSSEVAFELCHGAKPAGQVSMTPDGRNVVVGTTDNLLHVWDAATQTYLRTIRRRHSGGRFVITPDSQSVLSGVDRGGLRIWSISSGRCLRQFRSVGASRVYLAPNGVQIVWRSPAGPKERVKWSDLRSIRNSRMAGAYEDVLVGVEFTPDGRYVLTAGLDQTIRLWNLTRGECVAVYFDTEVPEAISEIDPAGRFVVTTNRGNLRFLRLTNVDLGDPIATPALLWRFGRRGTAGRRDLGATVICPWCRSRFRVRCSSRNAIRAINKRAGVNMMRPPCLVLPESAWSDSRLLASCRDCGNAVRLNPFFAGSQD